MRAIVATGYGPPEVLQLRELPKPVPSAGEVLVRVRATTVSTGDWRIRTLSMPTGFGLFARLMFGLKRPRQPVLGADLAGVVEAIGAGVAGFNVGDRVFAMNGARMGCHAEYKAISQDGAIALIPDDLSFEQAAALPFGGTTALHFLRRAGLRPGERVLVNGASGAVGSAAVQLARHFGAEVTGVCSTPNLELVRELGADHVIDYTREDFSTTGDTYDIILDTTGAVTFARARRSLRPGGRLLLVAAGVPQMLPMLWTRFTHGRRVLAGPAAERAEDLRLLAELADSGKLRPVIDRCYPFELAAEAHRYVGERRKRGSVVLTLTT